MKMNAYEIEQIEKDLKGRFRLPLAYNEWAEIERSAREERARVAGQAFKGFFAAVAAKIAGFGRQVRATAAECTRARLRRDH
jgi:hypothetical protein